MEIYKIGKTKDSRLKQNNQNINTECYLKMNIKILKKIRILLQIFIKLKNFQN